MNTSGIYLPQFQSRVRASTADLSSALRQVVDYLSDSPETAVFHTSAELGRLTGTSDATVIRTIKALGYSGLDELRREVREAIEDRLTPQRRMEKGLEWAGDDPEEILDFTLQLHMTLLDDARKSLSGPQFVAAVRLLAAAGDVVVFGLGPLGFIAEYLALRLSRIGLRSYAETATGFRMADGLLRLRSTDVVVMFAYDTIVRELDVALTEANRQGCSIILVTDSLGESLSDKVDTILVAPVLRNAVISSFTSSLLIADAMAFACSSQARERANQALTELGRLRADLGRVDSWPRATVRRNGSTTSRNTASEDE